MEEQKTPSLENASSLEVAHYAANVLYDKKGIAIKLYSVADTTVLCEYYLLCSGRASTHLHALADELIEKMGDCGVKSLRCEGRNGGEWLLVDFGSLIVHIFSKDAREYYNLERLLPAEGEISLAEQFEKRQSEKQEIENEV